MLLDVAGLAVWDAWRARQCARAGGADHLGRLELDQLLEHEGHGVAQDVHAVTGAIASSSLERADCELAMGVYLLVVNLGQNALRITPVAPDVRLSRCQEPAHDIRIGVRNISGTGRAECRIDIRPGAERYGSQQLIQAGRGASGNVAGQGRWNRGLCCEHVRFDNVIDVDEITRDLATPVDHRPRCRRGQQSRTEG